MGKMLESEGVVAANEIFSGVFDSSSPRMTIDGEIRDADFYEQSSDCVVWHFGDIEWRWQIFVWKLPNYIWQMDLDGNLILHI